MLFDLDIKLCLDYDPNTESISLKRFELVKQEKISDNSDPYCKNHLITDTQERYSILTLGKSMPIPLGCEITFIAKEINGNEKIYQIRSHRTIKGRLDGLRQFYKDFEGVLKIGNSYAVEYNTKDNVVIFHCN